MKLRVIVNLDGNNGYYQMALDEAMLLLRDRDEILDTLRLYVFKPSAVTIGYFQKIYEVVDVDKVKTLGIDVVRRFTGGGAVYHDTKGEITYSIALKIRDELTDIARSYEIICKGIVEALRLFGVEAQFRPINDVVVLGKKISGSAQARKKNALLQHGTFMYATDIDTMVQVLKPPREKLLSKGITDIRQRVITLKDVLGYAPDPKDVAQALIQGFSKALGAEVYVDELTEKELRLAEELLPKYRSKEWLFRR